MTSIAAIEAVQQMPVALRVCGTCGVSRELGMYITKTGRDVRTCRKCRDHSRKHFLRSKIRQPYEEWLNRLAEQVRLFYDSPWQTAEVRTRIEQDLRALVEKNSVGMVDMHGVKAS